MPSEITTPAKTERYCAPCEHHKLINAFYSSAHGQSWREYSCTHPEAECAHNPELAKLLADIGMPGRHIGRTEKQPAWCPLLRDTRETADGTLDERMDR